MERFHNHICWSIFKDEYGTRDDLGARFKVYPEINQLSLDRRLSPLFANSKRDSIFGVIVTHTNSRRSSDHRRGSRLVDPLPQLVLPPSVLSIGSLTASPSNESRRDSMQSTSTNQNERSVVLSVEQSDLKLTSPMHLTLEQEALFRLTPIEMVVEMNRVRVLEEFICDGFQLGFKRALQLANRAVQLNHNDLIFPLYKLAITSDLRYSTNCFEDLVIVLNLERAPFSSLCEMKDLERARMLLNHLTILDRQADLYGQCLHRIIQYDFIDLFEWLVPLFVQVDKDITIFPATVIPSQMNYLEMMSMFDASIRFGAMNILNYLLRNHVALTQHTLSNTLNYHNPIVVIDLLLEERREEFLCMLGISLREILQSECSSYLLRHLLEAFTPEQNVDLLRRILFHFRVFQSNPTFAYSTEMVWVKFIPILDLYLDWLDSIEKEVVEETFKALYVEIDGLDRKLAGYFQFIHRRI